MKADHVGVPTISRFVRVRQKARIMVIPILDMMLVMNQKETDHNLCHRTNTEFSKTAVQQQTCPDCLPQYREKNPKC